jgi:hypothetical protein
MEDLRIAATKTSPGIFFNPGGVLKIDGRSIHENISDFFKPVELWIKEYTVNPAEVTCLDIKLEYFNSASSKIFIRLIQNISYVQLKHKKFTVNWYYEDGDEDILERGEYFSSLLKIPFSFIKIS